MAQTRMLQFTYGMPRGGQVLSEPSVVPLKLVLSVARLARYLDNARVDDEIHLGVGPAFAAVARGGIGVHNRCSSGS